MVASIGVPLAIGIASKIFGKGLNISRRSVPQIGSSRGGRGLQVHVSQKPGYLTPYQPAHGRLQLEWE